MTSRGPLLGSVPRGQDPEKLRAMLDVYRAESDVLKERLADGQGEVATLRSRLRDAEGELQVAHQATNTATERLGLHAQRHGLVLAAGVERIGAERATLEDDLQRMEHLLSERDQEIARLRREARKLEAQHFHSEMELHGLQAASAGGGPSLLQMDDPRNGDLMEQFSLSAAATGPSSRETVRHGDARAALAARQEALEALRQRAELAAREAQHLEEEEKAIAARVAEAERSLREKHLAMEAQDREFVKEQELLREHNEKLRQALQLEQHDSVSIDQRAVLHQQCGTEAEGVRNEVLNILATMPQLAETLAARAKYVHSAEVPGDPVDVHLQAYLRSLGPSTGTRPPAIVCRLGPGDYVVDRERVAVSVEQGQVVFQRPGQVRISDSSSGGAGGGAVAISASSSGGAAAVAASDSAQVRATAVRPSRQRSSIC